MTLPQVFSGVHVIQSLCFTVGPFVLFLSIVVLCVLLLFLSIVVLCVLLRLTVSDFLVGILKYVLIQRKGDNSNFTFRKMGK